MATVELVQVEKKFGELQAVKPMDLTINDGEFVVLLGPSGCGKTTTLRMISGLEAVTGGQILIDGRDVTWAHPAERDISFVFQFYALYPHLTAWRNIAFPLQAEGESRANVNKRVAEVSQMLGIEHLLHLRPNALSGGDKQRVGLARALVRRPAAFLMDEPIGALDADARETMRAEIKQFHITLNATTVYVTHDQVEAMAMGDRIVVMSAAEVQQVGTPAEVYYKPANLFVARFIGSPGMNLVPGKLSEGVVQLPGASEAVLSPEWKATLEQNVGREGDVILGFRPETGQISDSGALAAEVYATELYGAYTMLHLSIGEEVIHIRAERGVDYPLGEMVRFDLDPEMMRFFNPETEAAITREVG
ncbi:MAG: ATP-binding cassette domain-containing protein [Anaerolineae bacterium]|nr:ATP-binding cassette domain-containing protein [Anaerolineae bacterium]